MAGAPAPLRLEAGDPADRTRIRGRVELALAGDRLTLDMIVPTGPVAGEVLLPMLQGLCDAITDHGVARAEAKGEHVSCRIGCAACCRQLVPLAETEARAIAALVDALPEPRRATMRARFAVAAAELDASGLTAQIEAEGPAKGAVSRAGLAYLALRLDCPFLDDEMCSIHAVRPMACREYLVTSPPERCGAPADGGVEGVDMAGSVVNAMVNTAHRAGRRRWLPLPDALRFVAANPDPAPPAPAPDQLAAIFNLLAR